MDPELTPITKQAAELCLRARETGDEVYVELCGAFLAVAYESNDQVMDIPMNVSRQNPDLRDPAITAAATALQKVRKNVASSFLISSSFAFLY
jgi:hypothetical protein